MNVRMYQPSDLSPTVYRMGDHIGRGGLAMAHGSFVRTLTQDGEVAAVFGLVVRWQGVGDIWAVVTDAARGHGIALTKQANRLLVQFSAELDIRRVGALVRDTQEEYIRWAKLMGFVPEYVMRGAAPDGGDIIGYVRWMSQAPRIQ